MPKDSVHYRNARLHALQRAKERYGVTLTNDDYRWLSNRLRAQIGKLIGIQGDGTEIWLVTRRKQVFQVAYDRGLNGILTFFPPGAKVEVAVTPRRAS